MKAIFTPTTGVIRVFESDDAEYGQKYKISLPTTLYEHGRVCYIEGLVGGMSLRAKSAIAKELKRIGVRYARWSHTNDHGHEVNACYDVQTGKVKYE